jgi:mannose-1-phosphate guanylyltransferase
VVTTDHEGRVMEFVEKPPKDDAPTNLINAGTYVFEPSFLDRVPLGERVSIERVVFPAMAAEGALFAMAETSYWLDTGTPATFLQANFDLLEGRRAGPPRPHAGKRPDGTWGIDEESMIGVISGSCLIGKGSVVAEGAKVERSVLGAGSVVRRSAVVSASVLLPDVTIGEGARVEEAIIGSGARIGAECVVRAGSVIGFDVELAAGSEVDGRMPA